MGKGKWGGCKGKDDWWGEGDVWSKIRRGDREWGKEKWVEGRRGLVQKWVGEGGAGWEDKQLSVGGRVG